MATALPNTVHVVYRVPCTVLGKAGLGEGEENIIRKNMGV